MSPQPVFLEFCSFVAQTGSSGVKTAKAAGPRRCWTGTGCGRNPRPLQAEELRLSSESVFSVFILIVSAVFSLGRKTCPGRSSGPRAVCRAPRELCKAQARVWAGSAQCLPGCPAQRECSNQRETSVLCLRKEVCEAGRGLAEVGTVVCNGTVTCLFLPSVPRALPYQF